MEKGPSNHLGRGADHLPNPEAFGRAAGGLLKQTGRFCREHWQDAVQGGTALAFFAGLGYLTFGIKWGESTPPTPAPRAAGKPNPPNPTATALRPRASEAVVSGLGQRYDNNRLLAENVDPYHPRTFMNYGVDACGSGAVALGDKSFLEEAFSFLSPRVAEAAPLEAKTPEEFIECIKGIERQRPFLSRFDINVQNWTTDNVIGLNSIAFWRQELAGELRERGFDMTPEEMGSFIGQVIPTTFRDPNTSEVKLFGAVILDDKVEVDRQRAAGNRTVHWSGEKAWMAIDETSGQVVGTFEDCDNAFIPSPLRKMPATPTPVPATPSPTATEQPAQLEQPEQPEQPGPEEERPQPTPTPAPPPQPTRGVPQPTQGAPTASPVVEPTRGQPQPTQVAPTASPVVVPTRGVPQPTQAAPTASPVVEPTRGQPQPIEAAPTARPVVEPTRGVPQPVGAAPTAPVEVRSPEPAPSAPPIAEPSRGVPSSESGSGSSPAASPAASPATSPSAAPAASPIAIPSRGAPSSPSPESSPKPAASPATSPVVSPAPAGPPPVPSQLPIPIPSRGVPSKN